MKTPGDAAIAGKRVLLAEDDASALTRPRPSSRPRLEE
jgi:hypothetical protein